MRKLHPTAVRVIEILAEHALEAGLTPAEISQHLEKRCLELLLEVEGGQCAAALKIGIHRNTIGRHIKRLGIERKGYTAKHGNRPQLLKGEL